MIHPIENIQWLDAVSLKPNDYNPNVVMNKELELLALSIIKNGWMQPILVDQDLEIIDGFHRDWLCINHKEVRALTDGKVPCCIMPMSRAERMLLTIRINRAKGNHIALRMHKVVAELVNELGMTKERVAKEIGANVDEIELLLTENVFKKLDTSNHNFSKAWVPKV